jgi:putative PIN family toxin of toxin-antitoxin system
MRLVIDSNILVSELLRKRGRNLIELSELELYLAKKMKNEAQYELQKRISIIVSQTKLTEALGKKQLEAALRLIESKIITVPLFFYQSWEIEARKRIPRDPNDWETVALSLALPAAIWTEDYDFFGCGCPTWTTETLLRQVNVESS